MSGRRLDKSMPGSARLDWSRVTLAVRYAEETLHERFNGDGFVQGRKHRGWLRSRLRELLEAFPTVEAAHTWTRAACFKAQGKARPMAYFATLVSDASRDGRMRDLHRLLSAEEFRDFRLGGDRQPGPATPERKGTA